MVRAVKTPRGVTSRSCRYSRGQALAPAMKFGGLQGKRPAGSLHPGNVHRTSRLALTHVLPEACTLGAAHAGGPSSEGTTRQTKQGAKHHFPQTCQALHGLGPVNGRQFLNSFPFRRVIGKYDRKQALSYFKVTLILTLPVLGTDGFPQVRPPGLSSS